MFSGVCLTERRSCGHVASCRTLSRLCHASQTIFIVSQKRKSIHAFNMTLESQKTVSLEIWLRHEILCVGSCLKVLRETCCTQETSGWPVETPQELNICTLEAGCPCRTSSLFSVSSSFSKVLENQTVNVEEFWHIFESTSVFHKEKAQI